MTLNIASPGPTQLGPPPKTQARRKWLPSEDEYLKDQVRHYQLGRKPIDWTKVARGLPNRNNKDCRKRWLKVDDKWAQGSWSQEEDDRLKEAVSMFHARWKAVSDFVLSRSPDQCAKRWKNSLDPTLVRRDWDDQDDALLLKAVDQFGRNWKSISERYFPQRSRLDLSNRFTLLTRKQRNGLLPIKQSQDPYAVHFRSIYASHSPEITSDDSSSRTHGSYQWSNSVSPVQSLLNSPPGVHGHSPGHHSRLSLSSHRSIDEITNPSPPTGYVVNNHQTDHSNHSRIHSAPPVFSQNVTYRAQTWSEQRHSVIDPNYVLPPLMSVQEAIQSAVDGHVQNPHSQQSHGAPAHSMSTPATTTVTVSPPVPMENAIRRSPPVSPAGGSPLSLPLQVDPSTGSQMLYNALNQGNQVTLVFH